MKKFEGLLFCTDLDGTLYKSDKTVSKENLESIEYFKSEGGLFTFITGRSPTISKEMCEIVKPNAPYGCLNGGGIFDSQENKYIWNMPLADNFIELVRDVDKNLPDMGIQLNTEDKIYFCKNNPGTALFRQITGVPNLTCHYDEVGNTVLKVVFVHMEESQILALQKLLNTHPLANEFNFIRSAKILYEILPKGTSKGNLLLKMAELFGIDPKKTIAVGDYNNDVSMIRAAGIGFAVENAVPEAKAAADYITVSNDEHAIAAIIDGLDKGIYAL